ncbi:hypothetical protein V2J09_022498 [Rumex salicifolius]
MSAKLRWVMQLHRDVPKAAHFYSRGLDFTIDVCSLRWAELHSGPLSIALLHSPSEHPVEKDYSSLLSFTVPDINSTVTKLMALGAELDGPINHEIHGKVAAIRCLDGHMIGLYEPLFELVGEGIKDQKIFPRHRSRGYDIMTFFFKWILEWKQIGNLLVSIGFLSYLIHSHKNHHMQSDISSINIFHITEIVCFCSVMRKFPADFCIHS